MNEPKHDLPSEAAELLRRLDALPRPAFAAVDGAAFDDLPLLLRAVGLSGRSLFLDHADADVERAGPWHVPLRDSAETEAFARMAGGRSLAAFWAGIDSEDLHFRHLRTLNMARIPGWAAEGYGRRPANRDDALVTVLFRHWDPRVLDDLMPVLDAAQFARILGPASELGLVGNDGRFRRVVADPDWPTPAPGMLVLTGAQAEALCDRRMETSRRAVGAYLREVGPEELDELTDAELRERVLAYERSGDDLGLRSEPAHKKWAYVCAMTGESEADEVTKRWFRSHKKHPDEAIDEALEELDDILRAHGMWA